MLSPLNLLRSLRKWGSNKLTGDVALAAGANVTLTQDDALGTITIAADTGGGGGGVTDHALLTHLDYASAGHTGFAGTGVANTFSLGQTFQAAPTSPGSGSNSERWGAGTTTDGQNSTAVGQGAGTSTSLYCTAVGSGASVSSGCDFSVALGALSSVTGNHGVAIGVGAVSGGGGSVAIGPGVSASSPSSVVVGNTVSASGSFSGPSVGSFVSASATYALGYGFDLTASHVGAVLLGANLASTRQRELVVGCGAGNGAGVWLNGHRIRVTATPSDNAPHDVGLVDFTWGDSTAATRAGLVSLVGCDWTGTDRVAVTGGSDGTQSVVGFHGVTPVGRQTAAADATDLASAIALVNDLKAKLQTYGLLT